MRVDTRFDLGQAVFVSGEGGFPRRATVGTISLEVTSEKTVIVYTLNLDDGGNLDMEEPRVMNRAEAKAQFAVARDAHFTAAFPGDTV